MSPASETIAFRVWAFCTPREWDCTIAECADALGLPLRRVANIIGKKGWTGRFRVETNRYATRFERGQAIGASSFFDQELEALE